MNQPMNQQSTTTQPANGSSIKAITPQQMADALGLSLRSAKRYLRAHHSRQSFDGGETYQLSANDFNRAHSALQRQSGLRYGRFQTGVAFNTSNQR